MKLLVFAHTPPPHHGQSYMVQLMLAGFGGDRRKRRRKSAPANPDADAYGIQCYHVNARVSKRLEDIGEFRGSKLFLLLLHCLEAVWCRFRHGVTDFYYIPAPGKKSALYRDWLVMFVCRPFFKKVILHWHAAGLAKWLETSVQIRYRAMTYHLLKQVDLSIVLSKYNIADAEKLLPRRVRVVSNGIPDPCPDFATTVLPRRKARFAARTQLLAGQQPPHGDFADTGGDPQFVKVLFLAHCTREKGLFDAAQAVVLANRALATRHSSIRMKLRVTGSFVISEEKLEFDRMMANREFAEAISYGGFVASEQKDQALREADLFCFPTYYQSENQPVNLIEAMAFGLPLVTTRWRSLPEMLPPDYPGLVDVRAPDQIATALLSLMAQESGEGLRESFFDRFTIERHLAGLAEAISDVEQPTASLSRAIAASPT